MPARAVALALTLSALAGCLAPVPAEVVVPASTLRGVDDLVHDLGAIIEASVPVEGAELHGTVYLPDVAEGEKVPVILDLGPYYGNLNPETSVYREDMPPNRLYHHFLQRGYAVALMSLRGTGQSSGCFEIGGPRENADAAAAVEWLAAQEWSNGAVAMTGVSYDGTTPWEAAVSGAAPSLKAIIPVESISDHYRYSFFEGVPIGGGATFNTYYLALVDVFYGPGLGVRVPAPDDVAAWATVQPSNVCPETADVLLSPYETFRDGVHGPFWDARDMSAELDKATVPIFVVQGFKDFNVKMDHVQTLWPHLPPGSRMLLGQWEHNIPWANTYDEDLSFADYNTTMDSFLDAYLKGDPAALAEQAAAPRVLVQDSAGVVHAFDAWPPAEAVATPWFLGDGTLEAAPAADGEARFRGSPVAQNVGRVPRAPELLPDAARFESGAFAADTLVAGNPVVTLNVTVDRAEGQVEATLWRVKGEERTLLSMGWQDLSLRTSRDTAEAVPVGEPVPLRILMEAVAEVVPAGETLVLELSASNSNASAAAARPQVTAFTVALGGEDGAKVFLPIVA